MKLWGSGGTLYTHMQQPSTSVCGFWRIERMDGVTLGRVECDIPVTIDGVIYVPTEGIGLSTAHTSSDMTVDTLDVTAFIDDITEADIRAGVYDKAILTSFEANYLSPPATVAADTCNIVRYGRLGQLQRQTGQLKAEIRGLSQQLSTRIGILYSPTCPWRLGLWDVGSQTYVSSVQCGLDLTGGFITTGTVTIVGSDAQLQCNDSGNSQPNEWFSEGIITMTSGPNMNISREVRRWADKRFELWRRFPYPIAIGHTYSALAGDDYTESTCLNKFANIEHFLGFPDVPGINKVFSIPVRL